MEGTTKYAKGAKMGTQIVFKGARQISKCEAIGPVGELRSLSKNRTRTVLKSNLFAIFACFVVERKGGYLSSYFFHLGKLA